MSEIRTYADLVDEARRIQAALDVQKDLIRQDVRQLHEELKPALRVLSVIGKITKPIKQNPMLTAGMSIATDLLLTHTVLGRTSRVTKSIVPFLVKKVSGFFLSAKPNFLQKITGRWRANGKH